MSIIGIDPGRNGGGVLLHPDGSLGPWVSGDNALEMLTFLIECRNATQGTLRAAIEFQQPWPRIAAKANFQVGIGYGFWRGLLTAQGIGYEAVRSQEWQKIITKRKGWSRKDLKEALMAEACRRWPELGHLGLNKEALSGVCDAALIAEFTRTRGTP